MDFCEFEVILVYKASFRAAEAIQKKTCLEKPKLKERGREIKRKEKHKQCFEHKMLEKALEIH